jgi:hypothetical protein
VRIKPYPKGKQKKIKGTKKNPKLGTLFNKEMGMIFHKIKENLCNCTQEKSLC